MANTPVTVQRVAYVQMLGALKARHDLHHFTLVSLILRGLFCSMARAAYLCGIWQAVTADVHIASSERPVNSSLEFQSVELLARLQDSQGSIARLESMVTYLRSRLDSVEDLRLAYLHSQNVRVVVVVGSSCFHLACVKQEVAAQRDQVALLHRERDRLVKHHVMLEDALTEVRYLWNVSYQFSCVLQAPLACLQEILLLERQNLQLQESLTRTSAAADRAACWATEASERYEQVIASGNGKFLLQHNAASLRPGDGMTLNVCFDIAVL